jgi:ATP-dependent RNA helicase DDX19/DBP5
MVINYDLPYTFDKKPDFETYLHRIGRTGRFGRQGVSISFVHDGTSWENLHKIEKYFRVPIYLIPGDNIDIFEKMVTAIVKGNKDMMEKHNDMYRNRHAPRKS